MLRRNLTLLAVVVALSAVLGLAYVLLVDRGIIANGGWPTSTQSAEKTALSYPAGWDELPVSKADEETGVLLKLRRADPPAEFQLRGVVGQVDDSITIEALARQTEKALKSELEGLESVKASTTTIGGTELAHLRYVQQEEGDPRFLNDMYILPTANQTFYLTFRYREATEKDLAADRSAIIEKLVDYIDQRTKS